jgi:hypothetical protein
MSDRVNVHPESVLMYRDSCLRLDCARSTLHWTEHDAYVAARAHQQAHDDDDRDRGLLD